MQELKVIADFYDFTLWLTRHIEKFPRHHRYSLGLHMEQQLYLILKNLLRAKYRNRNTPDNRNQNNGFRVVASWPLHF